MQRDVLSGTNAYAANLPYERICDKEKEMDVRKPTPIFPEGLWEKMADRWMWEWTSSTEDYVCQVINKMTPEQQDRIIEVIRACFE